MHSFTDRSHPVIDSDLGTAPDGHQAYEMHGYTALLHYEHYEMIDVLLQNTSPRRSQSTPVTVTTLPVAAVTLSAIQIYYRHDC